MFLDTIFNSKAIALLLKPLEVTENNKNYGTIYKNIRRQTI